MRRLMIVLLAFLILTGCAAANVPPEGSSSPSSNQEQGSSEPAPIVSAESQESDDEVLESEPDASNSMHTAADVPPEESSSPSSNQEQVSTESTSTVSSESQEPDDEVLESEPDASNSIEKPEARSEVQAGADTQSKEDAAYESRGRGSENVPSSYQRWLEDIKKERKIKDFSKYSAAMSKIQSQIEEALDDTQYSGIDDINIIFIEKETGEHIPTEIGLTINYVNLEKVQPVVEKYMEQYNSAEGIIDIEYKKCKYSLVELKKIKKEIESQPFNDVLRSYTFRGGHLYITKMIGYDDLERFLANKPYKDAVVIHEESDVPIPVF